MRFEFEGVVFRWESRADAEWLFVPLPASVSADIAEIPRPRRGFGAVRVRARIGRSEWGTSIFPNTASGTYVLPLKRAVRDAEAIELGASVQGSIEIVGL